MCNASLVDITRHAGQRNRGALRYHFGSREDVLCAVLDRHADFLRRREGELLAGACAAPDDDLAAVVEAVVRPAAELAASGSRGRYFLLIVADLVGEDPAHFGPELAAVLARTGGHEVYALLVGAMPHAARPSCSPSASALVTTFILRSVADRARILESRAAVTRPAGARPHAARPQLAVTRTSSTTWCAMVAARPVARAGSPPPSPPLT